MRECDFSLIVWQMASDGSQAEPGLPTREVGLQHQTFMRMLEGRFPGGVRGHPTGCGSQSVPMCTRPCALGHQPSRAP